MVFQILSVIHLEKNLLEIFNLLGHIDKRQAFVSVASSPSHSELSFLLSSPSNNVLLLVCVPDPHVTEHWLHEPKFDHTHSSGLFVVAKIKI